MDDYLSTQFLYLDPETYSDNQSWFLLSEIIFNPNKISQQQNMSSVDNKVTPKLTEQKNQNF